MKNYVIYFIIVFGVTSCGSRKTDTNISKSSNEVRQEERTKSEEKQTEKSTAEKSEETKNDITDKESVKQTITEFGNDGKPTKQTVTETQRDRTDKSSNNKKEKLVINKIAHKKTDSVITVTQKQTAYVKDKETKANNWGIPALGIVAVLGVLVWLYFKFKK